MDKLLFSFDSSLVSKDDLRNCSAILSSEIEKMNRARGKGYSDGRSIINLPFDAANLKDLKKVIAEKKREKPSILAMAGIGGAVLGTIAVHEAVNGKRHNDSFPKIRPFFFDNADPDWTASGLAIIEQALKKKEKVLAVIVSKSGTTTETIVNGELLLSLMKKYKRDITKEVVVVSTKESKFTEVAKQLGCTILSIPEVVPDRCSVFTNNHLFTLAMLDIDIAQLLKGASDMVAQCLEKDPLKNPAALSAAVMYTNFRNGKNINDHFFFSVDLESVGKWYRQLMGESIGKEKDNNGKTVWTGPTPTVTIGSTDLHSLGQLYLGGPFDKLTTFVRVENNNNRVKVPVMKEFDSLVANIQGIQMNSVMNAIYDGTKAAFIKGKRPFCEITLPDKSAYSIGQFLQFKLVEMIYLAALLNVNPFDQPNVESYKSETRAILASGKR